MVIIAWSIHALFWSTIIYFVGSFFITDFTFISALTILSVWGTIQLFRGK